MKGVSWDRIGKEGAEKGRMSETEVLQTERNYSLAKVLSFYRGNILEELCPLTNIFHGDSPSCVK